MRTSGLTLAAAREGWCVGIRWNHVSGWRILAKFSVTMLVSNDLLMFDNIFIAHMNTPGLIGPCGANWRRGCFVCIAVRCGSSWVINLLMHQMCRIWWIIWTLRPFSESTSLSDVAQVKSTVSPKKTILNNVLSILQPAIIIIICKIVSVSFWILPCLSTPLKKKNLWQVIQWRAMASVTGRLYLVTAYLDERQGPMWEATHSYGLKLRKLQQTYSTNRKWLFLCVLCHVMCFIYITWHLVGIKWVH